MNLTTLVTKNDKQVIRIYQICCFEQPSEEQLKWWLKVHAVDVDDEICYERVLSFDTINLYLMEDLPLVEKFPEKDPLPKIKIREFHP